MFILKTIAAWSRIPEIRVTETEMFQEDGMPSLVRGSGAFPGENRAPQKSAFLVNSETFATRFGVFDESSASFSFGQSTPAAS